jgi:hypothetical protein
MADQLKLPSADLGFYEWSGRAIDQRLCGWLRGRFLGRVPGDQHHTDAESKYPGNG